MLNLTNLIGFGAEHADLKLTYAGRVTWTGTLEGSGSVNLPVDTVAVIITGHTSMNASTTALLQYVRVDGADATQILLAQRLDEYRCDSSIWLLNDVFQGTRSITAKKSAGAGGASVNIWAVTKRFVSYGADSSDTDVDASDPLDCNVDIYKGGIAIASWFSKFGAASCTYLDTGYEVTNDGCTAGMLTTEDLMAKQILMEDGSGLNDGQTACVASFKPERFI